MAQSLCEMFLRSPNTDFTSQGKAIFEVSWKTDFGMRLDLSSRCHYQSLREKQRAVAERAWDDLANLKTRSNAPAVPFDVLEELREQTMALEDNTEEGGGASTEEEFVDVVCAALTVLYVREVKPGKKDLYASEKHIF